MSQEFTPSEIIARIEGIDSRVSGVDDRIDGVEDRIENYELRASGLSDRTTGVDGRLTLVDQRLNSLGLDTPPAATLQNEIDNHEAISVINAEGAHDYRIYEDKQQYWNGASWIDVAGGGGEIYILPQATETDLGGIRAKIRTTEANEVAIDSITGKLYSSASGGSTGETGATFTPVPTVEGATLNLSWTNDKELPNPSPVAITAPQGDKGDKGDTGAAGFDSLTIDTTTVTPSVEGSAVLPTMDMIVTFESGATKTFKVVAVE